LALSAAILLKIQSLETKIRELKLEKLGLEHSIAVAKGAIDETARHADRVAIENVELRRKADSPLLEAIDIRIRDRWVYRPAADCPNVLPAAPGTPDETTANAAQLRDRERLTVLGERVEAAYAQLGLAIASDLRNCSDVIIQLDELISWIDRVVGEPP